MVSNLPEALKQIEQLPSAVEKEWPPMPREMFSVVQEFDALVHYKGEYIVHFGMCVKEIEGQYWVEWLERFENLCKSMKAEEAFVVLKTVPYLNPEGFDGRWYYKWSLEYSDETGIPIREQKPDDRIWIFKGDTRELYGD